MILLLIDHWLGLRSNARKNHHPAARPLVVITWPSHLTECSPAKQGDVISNATRILGNASYGASRHQRRQAVMTAGGDDHRQVAHDSASSARRVIWKSLDVRRRQRAVLAHP